MRTARGFTLVELLIVISIIGILGVLTFANFKDFSQAQILSKAITDTQTILRQAQSNATSSTLCNNTGGLNWGVNFNSSGTGVDLICGPADSVQKTINFTNVKVVSIKGSSCISKLNLPFKISYSPLYGKVTFTGSDNCIALSPTITLSITNNKTGEQKSFNITQGGATDAQ